MDVWISALFVRSKGCQVAIKKLVIAKGGRESFLASLILSSGDMNRATTTAKPDKDLNQDRLPAQDLVDIHRLDLRFKQVRINRPRLQSRLGESIPREGLHLPIQIADTGEQLVVIDGYQRLQAFCTLQKDRIPAHCYQHSLEEAIREWFANQNGRNLDPVEEAWLIQQLLDEGRSRTQVAKSLGRGESWISRRIALLEGFSPSDQQALREGVISSWAASRILIPLARANRGDADQLMQALQESHLSTRELSTWYQHYLQSGAQQRTRLLSHPRLFLDALQQTPETKPEPDPLQKWMGELKQISYKLNQLQRQLKEQLLPLPQQHHLRVEAAALSIQESASEIHQKMKA